MICEKFSPSKVSCYTVYYSATKSRGRRGQMGRFLCMCVCVCVCGSFAFYTHVHVHVWYMRWSASKEVKATTMTYGVWQSPQNQVTTLLASYKSVGRRGKSSLVPIERASSVPKTKAGLLNNDGLVQLTSVYSGLLASVNRAKYTP